MASEPTSTPQTEPSTPKSERKSGLVIEDKRTGKVIWHPDQSLEENRTALKQWNVEQDKAEEQRGSSSEKK
jgi:hypothetical protein